MYSCTETRPEVDGCVVSAFGTGRGQELITAQPNRCLKRGIKGFNDRDSGFTCISLLMGDQCATAGLCARSTTLTKEASDRLIRTRQSHFGLNCTYPVIEEGPSCCFKLPSLDICRLRHSPSIGVETSAVSTLTKL